MPVARTPQAEKPSGLLIGYARVSTEDQSLQLQIDALRRAGVRENNIHIDKGSASSVKKRGGLAFAIKDCREGDVLVVWKLDRLTRFMPDLYWILAELDRRGAGLRSITEHIDTTTASGRLGMNMAASFAQYERETIAERTKAGLDAIKQIRGKGWKWGPKRIMTDAKIKRAGKLLNGGSTGPKVAKTMGVSTASIYNFWRWDDAKRHWLPKLRDK